MGLGGAFNGDFNLVGQYRLAEIVIHTHREATLSVFFHILEVMAMLPAVNIRDQAFQAIWPGPSHENHFAVGSPGRSIVMDQAGGQSLHLPRGANQERFSAGGPTTDVFSTNSDSKWSRFSVPFLKAGPPIGKTSVPTVFSFATRLLHPLDSFAFPCM
jgi:hypothetical protein